MSIAFEKSVASHPRSKYWSYKLNKINPEEILNNNSGNKYWFHCDICDHNFDISLSHLNEGKWCRYCNSGTLCNNDACTFCFNKSFKSNPLSQYWDNEKNENVTPRDITKSSGKSFNFICKNGHSFNQKINYINNGKWCKICCNSKRLCNKDDCIDCYNNSFASHPKSVFWNPELNKQIMPRQKFRCNNNKFWFFCNKCNHNFNISLNHVSDGKWCCYCNGDNLCNNDDCTFCFNKSFASCKYSLLWVNKLNTVTPRQICKNSGKKFWFKCTMCNTNYNKYLPDVTRGIGCPKCVNKTELKLFNMLVLVYPSLIHSFSIEWCKNIRCLPYDFVIHELNIIIELDGPQHFEQISNWESPEIQYENDKYKEKCANENNYSTIRLLQEDVWNDKNDWFVELQNAIIEIIHNKKIQNIYICKNNIYSKYL
jgi:very-short-patch-repair endonuclease